jgi:hypothetical protein
LKEVIFNQISSRNKNVVEKLIYGMLDYEDLVEMCGNTFYNVTAYNNQPKQVETACLVFTKPQPKYTINQGVFFTEKFAKSDNKDIAEPEK